MDISHAMALAGSLKTAGEITKAMIGIRDGVVLQAKVIELNGIILSAQGSALAANQDQFALLKLVRDLEAKVAETETWKTEKQRYALTDYGSGTFAYALKKEEARGEPPHRICANCYEQGRKSILQFEVNVRGQDNYKCPACNKDFGFGTRAPIVVQNKEWSPWP